MLLQFSVSNFRSIRTKQVFSLVSGPDKALLSTNSIETGIPALPRVLRVGALYGANAAGKSNLLKAMEFMRSVVVDSATSTQEGQEISVVPFAFDLELAKSPSEFEIHFIESGIRFEYGFRLTKERVIEEWLNAKPKGRIQKWFHRSFSAEDAQYNYSFGSILQGQKQVWEKSTRANALFLSTAVQLNSEQLKSVFNWFKSKLVVMSNTPWLSNGPSAAWAKRDTAKPFLTWLMKTADKSIEDFRVEEVAPEPGQLERVFSSKMVEMLSAHKTDDVSVLHRTKDGNEFVPLKLTEESAGTQRLFSFAWPWMEAIVNSSVLLVDEIDASLHPLMTRFLVSMFLRPFEGDFKPQLVFTTHDTSLLNGESLRRDQIWFAEKDEYNSSCFYPLTDFSPRKGEALEKGYLHGRYGALPFIGEYKF
jgi:AAA15 family ATPase/GTPase